MERILNLKGKNVIIPLCGGNIDSTALGRCIDRGLAATGRLCKFVASISDRPGGIHGLMSVIQSVNGCVKDIVHAREWINNDIFSVEVSVVVELNGFEHLSLLKNALTEANYKYVMINQPTVPQSRLRSSSSTVF